MGDEVWTCARSQGRAGHELGAWGAPPQVGPTGVVTYPQEAPSACSTGTTTAG